MTYCCTCKAPIPELPAVGEPWRTLGPGTVYSICDKCAASVSRGLEPREAVSHPAKMLDL